MPRSTHKKLGCFSTVANRTTLPELSSGVIWPEPVRFARVFGPYVRVSLVPTAKAGVGGCLRNRGLGWRRCGRP